MKSRKTDRGFDIFEFKDRNGVPCSLQASSIASEACIWLGCDDPDPQVMVPGDGWRPLEVPPGTLMNTRMHLTQNQVKKLLPILKKFAKTGSLGA